MVIRLRRVVSILRPMIAVAAMVRMNNYSRMLKIAYTDGDIDFLF